MQRFEAVIANTLVDAHHERLTREALCDLVNGVASTLVPLNVEHDPRKPPIGRVVSGFVRDRDDGVSEAVVVCEIFESQSDLDLGVDSRELPVHTYARPDDLYLSYDWTHRAEADQTEIAAVGEVLGTRPEYELRKSLDPISALIIGGAFALDGIATGFLNAIGAEGWKALASRLAKLTTKSAERTGDQLLIFRALVTNSAGDVVEVNTILTDPTPDQIDAFISTGIEQVDPIVKEALGCSADIRQLVLSTDGSHVELEFGVRKDCAPLGFGRGSTDTTTATANKDNSGRRKVD